MKVARNTLFTACSLAIAVASPPTQAVQVAKPAAAQQPTAVAELDWDVAILYRAGWSAEQMLNAPVRSAAGEQIGEVRDIILGADDKVTKSSSRSEDSWRSATSTSACRGRT